MDQQETNMVDPQAGSFQVIPESFLKMARCNVRRCKLNLCLSVLELDIDETKEFTVLNWVAGLANRELEKDILTVMSLDQKGNILCMLRLMELTLLDHETTFLQNSKATLSHTVHLKFETIERVHKKPIIGG